MLLFIVGLLSLKSYRYIILLLEFFFSCYCDFVLTLIFIVRISFSWKASFCPRDIIVFLNVEIFQTFNSITVGCTLGTYYQEDRMVTDLFPSSIWDGHRWGKYLESETSIIDS